MRFLLRSFLCTLFFFGCIPTITYAEENDPLLAVNQYLAVKIGYSGNFADPIRITDTATNTNNTAKTLLSTVNVNLSLGTYYAFAYVALRAEFDYTIRFNGKNETKKFSFTNTPDSRLQVYSTLHTVLANLYIDFNTTTRFVPYIGAGIGTAIVEDKFKFANSSSGKKLNFNFAWMATVGAAIYITPAIALDLQVRYTSMGTTKASLAGMNLKVDYSAAETMIGIRYTF